MENKEFKKLVKEIEGNIKKVYGDLKYTYLDFEFTAMRFIEDLKADNEVKRNLRIKFSNKANQMYYDARRESFDNILLMDRFDFFGEESEKEKKQEQIDLGIMEFLNAMDNLFQSMIEEKEERIPSEEELKVLRENDEELEKAYREALEEQKKNEELLNSDITPNDMEVEIDEEVEEYVDIGEDELDEMPLEDLTDEELEQIIGEIDDDDSEIPF